MNSGPFTSRSVITTRSTSSARASGRLSTGSCTSLALSAQGRGVELKVVELNVALTAYPEEQAAAVDKTRGSGEGGDARQLGLSVAAVPAERRAGLGLHAGVGVFVREVASGSIAESLGLAAGDVITQVNYGAVKDGPTGFDKAVKAVPAGEVLAFTIRRGDRFLFKAFTR